MKKYLTLFAMAALAGALVGGCQKPASTADNEQEIEKRVQERLAEEHQAERQKQLDDQAAQLQQRQQDLDAREQALQSAGTPAQTVAETEVSPAPDSEDEDEAPPTISNAGFYDSLSPYGAWLQVPGINGYVWQPYVAQQDPNWRPYRQGHWAYTDQGWAWVSNEPFGWATYHYGRWEQLADTGWVWIPGDQWAPAWVSWRQSDDYVGWAPLPPDNGPILSYDDGYQGSYDLDPGAYSFVPIADFCQPVIVNYIIATNYNTVICNKTVNITKIGKTKTRHGDLVKNPGPPPLLVQNKTKKPVKPLRIKPEQGPGSTAQRGDHFYVVTPRVPDPRQSRNRPANVQQVTRPAQPVRGPVQPTNPTATRQPGQDEQPLYPRNQTSPGNPSTQPPNRTGLQTPSLQPSTGLSTGRVQDPRQLQLEQPQRQQQLRRQQLQSSRAVQGGQSSTPDQSDQQSRPVQGQGQAWHQQQQPAVEAQQAQALEAQRQQQEAPRAQRQAERAQQQQEAAAQAQAQAQAARERQQAAQSEAQPQRQSDARPQPQPQQSQSQSSSTQSDNGRHTGNGHGGKNDQDQ